MKIGYPRVSTQDQKLELQPDALTRHGCEQVFRKKKSGKSKAASGAVECDYTAPGR